MMAVLERADSDGVGSAGVGSAGVGGAGVGGAGIGIAGIDSDGVGIAVPDSCQLHWHQVRIRFPAARC